MTEILVAILVAATLFFAVMIPRREAARRREEMASVVAALRAADLILGQQSETFTTEARAALVVEELEHPGYATRALSARGL